MKSLCNNDATERAVIHISKIFLPKRYQSSEEIDQIQKGYL